MNATPTIPVFHRTALWISAGVIVWVLHFTAIYGLSALACARGWSALVAPVIVAATAIASIALVVIIAAGLRRRGEFESWLAATIGALALVAVIYEAVPVLLLVAPCA